MFTKKVNYCLFIICIFCISSCTNGQTTSEGYFLKAYQCKDLECQLQNFNKAIEIDSKFAPAYYGKANVYYIQNKHKEKQVEFDKATTISNDYREIFNAYEKAYKIYPKNKFILTIFSSLNSMFGFDAKAFELSNLAIQIDPKFPQAYLERGGYYELKGENENSLKDYAKAIELDNNFAPAYLHHGAMLAIVFKEYDKGIADLDKAISLNPKFIAAYNSRAIAYKFKDNNQQAISDLSKSLEIAPNNAKIYRYRASIYKEIGETELAEKDEATANKLESKKTDNK